MWNIFGKSNATAQFQAEVSIASKTETIGQGRRTSAPLKTKSRWRKCIDFMKRNKWKLILGAILVGLIVTGLVIATIATHGLLLPLLLTDTGKLLALAGLSLTSLGAMALAVVKGIMAVCKKPKPAQANVNVHITVEKTLPGPDEAPIASKTPGKLPAQASPSRRARSLTEAQSVLVTESGSRLLTPRSPKAIQRTRKSFLYTPQKPHEATAKTTTIGVIESKEDVSDRARIPSGITSLPVGGSVPFYSQTILKEHRINQIKVKTTKWLSEIYANVGLIVAGHISNQNVSRFDTGSHRRRLGVYREVAATLQITGITYDLLKGNTINAFIAPIDTAPIEVWERFYTKIKQVHNQLKVVQRVLTQPKNAENIHVEILSLPTRYAKVINRNPVDILKKSLLYLYRGQFEGNLALIKSKHLSPDECTLASI